LQTSPTYGPGIDNILSMTVDHQGTPATYQYITDHFGTVHAVVDSTCKIVESYEYDAWDEYVYMMQWASPCRSQQ